jgi:hypothetical protein
VQPNDTLWDIATHYLTEPWRWPQLWHANVHISNPNWIYPGDVLQLNWEQGQPRLRKLTQAGKPVVRLSPQLRYTSKRQPIPTLPLSEIGPFLQRDQLFIGSSSMTSLPYVLGSNEKHTGMLDGEILYVQGALISGQEYGIYHPGLLYHDAQSGEVLGQAAILVGTAQVQAALADDRTQIVLTHSLREVSQGDKLLPLPAAAELPALFTPRVAPAISAGYIVDLPSQAQGGGKWDVVLINKGRRDQLAAGDLLAISRPGPILVSKQGKVAYEAFASTYDRLIDSGRPVTLPSEVIAKVMLFKVYDKLSYGLLVQSQEMVRIGYPVSHF